MLRCTGFDQLEPLEPLEPPDTGVSMAVPDPDPEFESDPELESDPEPESGTIPPDPDPVSGISITPVALHFPAAAHLVSSNPQASRIAFPLGSLEYCQCPKPAFQPKSSKAVTPHAPN